jgi:hypothetical protein
MRKALVIIGFAALACGRQETSTTAPTETMGKETPPVSAVQPPSEGAAAERGTAAEGAAAEGAAAEAEAAAAQPVEVTTCLELVSAAKYAEAIDVCRTAASLDPTNAAVAAALTKATTSAAAQGAAGAASAAAGAATETATGAAAGAQKAAGGAVDTAAGAAKGAMGMGEKKAAEGASKAMP